MAVNNSSAGRDRVSIIWIDRIAIEFKVRQFELTLTASLTHFLVYQIKLKLKNKID